MALLDLSRDQGCLPILWVISGTCGSRHMKGATWRVNTTPRKAKSTCLFLILNNSFNMKLVGRGRGEGDLLPEDSLKVTREQELKMAQRHYKSSTIAADSSWRCRITFNRSVVVPVIRCRAKRIFSSRIFPLFQHNNVVTCPALRP